MIQPEKKGIFDLLSAHDILPTTNTALVYVGTYVSQTVYSLRVSNLTFGLSCVIG